MKEIIVSRVQIHPAKIQIKFGLEHIDAILIGKDEKYSVYFIVLFYMFLIKALQRADKR